MHFPLDILDSIIFLLREDPESLIACSKAHPDLYQASERHLYHHITFHSTNNHYARASCNGYSPGASNLKKSLSETPRIANYVRILQIDFSGLDNAVIESKKHNFRTITPILPMFPSLECIILMGPRFVQWTKLPQGFKKAVKNCVHLPTVREMHVSDLDVSLSFFDNPSIVNYFLSGLPQIPDESESDNTNPQLRTLSLDVQDDDPNLKRFITWAKRRIVNLQSLKCGYLDQEEISGLLEVCSDTLNSLDFHVTGPYEAVNYDNAAKVVDGHGTSTLLNLSSLLHLQHLTIRAQVYFRERVGDFDDYSSDDDDGVNVDGEGNDDDYFVSHHPAIVGILKTPPPGLLHLVIDINVDLETNPRHLSPEDDILPLFPNFFMALAESFASIPHVDLYIHSGSYGHISSTVFWFGKYGELTPLIERGTLVIHIQETAPGNSQFVDICRYRWG